MRRSVFIVVLVLLGWNTFAQESERSHPFTYRRPGVMRLYTGLTAPPPDRPDKFDRFNTDFFWNSYLGDVNGVKTKFYALGHSINFMFDIPFDSLGRVGIGIGLGYSHFNIRNNGEVTFLPNTSGTGMYTHLAPYDPPKRWINRQVYDFIEVPFELRFRSARERGKFKFYPGFKAGFMFEYFQKWRIEKEEFKEFNFPDVNRWHYGPTIRIGFDNVMLFGYYDLAYIFNESQSNKLQLFAAGISIGWF